mmetsp:Transcript_16308/g.35274  ORF Transcript_16308/g.35274 Transcript_16308/m.35274 type:complete len:220 (-) Transcript_16308:839-1498(-)
MTCPPGGMTHIMHVQAVQPTHTNAERGLCCAEDAAGSPEKRRRAVLLGRLVPSCQAAALPVELLRALAARSASIASSCMRWKEPTFSRVVARRSYERSSWGTAAVSSVRASHSGGVTRLSTSLITLNLSSLSAWVVVVREGLALTSMSQGLSVSSMMMSYPYSSKQWRSLIMMFWQDLRLLMTTPSISLNSSSVCSMPRVASRYRRMLSRVHLLPCFSL